MLLASWVVRPACKIDDAYVVLLGFEREPNFFFAANPCVLNACLLRGQEQCA